MCFCGVGVGGVFESIERMNRRFRLKAMAQKVSAEGRVCVFWELPRRGDIHHVLFNAYGISPDEILDRQAGLEKINNDTVAIPSYLTAADNPPVTSMSHPHCNAG
ncbi:hypothetical protein CORC01_14113 [Colletotrichum orchidophilum]|uniref:Uncharacterized protein n=1 Tax=Colletotrichum orchidophilum TaxID=1209926 RepID=A0A1G4AN43_9PEZI|nr:uncharacterized protein CORC01_14113 [Colletotrichum orchidophilum]OHE90587.1 hypothetical protein CORC01_14113 [Colletotrichum orchidophilum]